MDATGDRYYIPSGLITTTRAEAAAIVAPLVKVRFSVNQFRVWLAGRYYGQRTQETLWTAFREAQNG